VDLTPSPAQEAFRREVRDLLRGREAQACLRAIRAAPRRAEPDARPVYRLLGAARLLAPHWPAELGGRGLGAVEAAIAGQELALHGVPDTLYVLSVQIAGHFLLRAGSPEQRTRLLPGMAAGRTFVTILYTEPEAGSDLAALTTEARPDGPGFRLHGRKVHNPKTSQAQLGLTAARVGEAGANKYAGLTLFLVPLDAPGVAVRPVPGLPPEQLHEVTLDGVAVGPDAVVGEVGAGWSLLSAALAAERTGMDLAARARRWLDAAISLPPGGGGSGWGGTATDDLESVGRLGAEVEASRLLAWQAVLDLGEGRLGVAQAAVAKWYASLAAQRVAWWAADQAGLAGTLTRDDEAAALGGLVELALAEAPGLTLSAGTSEMMLQLVAGDLRA
jgi:alkylation response protein AidB-like acyl-CoA dehydrogenase